MGDTTEAARHTGTAMLGERATLADILERGIELEWFEVVAIVLEVSKKIATAPRGRGEPNPELKHVELTAAGGVQLAATSPRGSQVVGHVGEMLQELLGEDVPVPLHLVVSQAAGPTPTYESLPALVDALVYFERPDRAIVIQGVYQRWLAALRHGVPKQARPKSKPKPQAEKKVLTPAQRTRRRRLVVLAAAAVLMVAAGWFIQRSPTALVTLQAYQGRLSGLWSDTQESLASGVASTREVLASGVTTVQERIGLVDEASAAPADSEATDAEPATAPTAPAASAVRRRASATRRPDAIEARGLESVDQIVTLLAAPSGGDGPPALDLPDGVGVSASAAAVYSREDADVAPPELVFPKIRTTPSDRTPKDAITVELLVAVSGEVEHVKLLAPPRRVPGIMMVSAIKAWRFQPATRDGAAVPYRTVMQINIP